MKSDELRFVVRLSVFMLMCLSGKKATTLAAFFAAHHPASDRIGCDEHHGSREPAAHKQQQQRDSGCVFFDVP
ncbi:MAG: hypothetical protein AB7I31_26480 [Blastocatellales bacterium]